MKTAILLGRCPDARGIVARTTGFIHQYEGNLLHVDHHADSHARTSFIRLEWEWEGFLLDEAAFHAAFAPLAATMEMEWSLNLSDERPAIGILVSKQDHCLADLLYLYHIGELPARIAFVAGNHKEPGALAEHYGVPFHYFATPSGDAAAKERAEAAILELARKNDVKLTVLARWMQILSGNFLSDLGCPVINIHHSFLPAFKGGRPYHQAAERGVKLIGATSHYVTEDLDEGPIIEQDVARVTHRDDAEALAHKGRDLERLVLSRAVRLHLQHRVLRHGNRTIVFSA
jgi:formyltetrahydrofolate deformylase